MAGIILTILKIIGIILLSILALLVLLIGIFLFLPIQYQVKAEKSAEKASGCLYLSWLFHIFRVRVEFGSKSGVAYSVKLLFFQVFPRLEKKHKIKENSNNNSIQKKAERSENPTKENVLSEKFPERNHEIRTEEPKESPQEEPKEEPEEEPEEESKPKEKPKEKEEEEEPKENPQTKSAAKKKTIVQLFLDKIRKLKFTFYKIYDKIKEICSGYEKFKQFVSSEELKGSLKFLNEQKKYLVRQLKPDRADAYVHFGTEDPALTGEILAVLSIIYPFYGYQLEVVPDFEQVCLEGNIYIKGRVQCYVMLLTAWRAYKNKYIRKMIEKYRK